MLWCILVFTFLYMYQHYTVSCEVNFNSLWDIKKIRDNYETVVILLDYGEFLKTKLNPSLAICSGRSKDRTSVKRSEMRFSIT